MRDVLRSRQGFTLIEVLIVVAIIAIGSAIAVPMMNQFAARYRLRGAARDITSTLQLIRLEAVKRKVNCVVVFGQQVNGQTFDYVAFVDYDPDRDPEDSTESVKNGNFVYEEGEEAVLSCMNFPATIALDTGGVTFDVNGAGLPAVAFNSRGFPRESGGVLLAADREVNLKNNIGGTKQVEMGPSGRVRIN